MSLYTYLTSKGYFIEILSEPVTCFNASDFGALMLIDVEKKFSWDEILKLRHDMLNKGLNLVVFAEWSEESLVLKH